MMKRPSHRELNNKIKQALILVENGEIAILNWESASCDAIDLDYDFESELGEVLLEILSTLTPHHYNGQSPPGKSYEDDIKGLDLFAFVVKIERFDHEVYFKFCLNQNIFWLVSLHKSRGMGGNDHEST